MRMTPRCFASVLASALALSPALASADESSQAAPKPASSSPRARRSIPMGVTGSVMLGLGFATLVTGGFMMKNNEVCTERGSPGGWLSGFSACEATQPRDPALHDALIGVMIGGGISLVVGIPLMIMGLRKRPVPPPVAALLGRPAPGGWGWSF